MTFDLPPRPARDGCSRRAARFAVWLALAGLVPAAGCWEEIRYQPSEAATRTKREERAERRETEAPDEDSSASEATTPVSAEPVSEPSEDELFGGDSETSEGEQSGVLAGEESVAPVDSAPTPEPAEPPAAPSLTEGLPFTETEPVVAPITPRERLDAWKAASGWSLYVAAVVAKGAPTDRYQPFLDDAERAAAALGIALPAIPAAHGEDAEREEDERPESDEERGMRIAEALRKGLGAELVTAIAERLDASAGASARLAIDSYLLLLTYSTDAAEDAAASLAASAEAAELPGRLWRPLVDLLLEGADFEAVRGAVFALHKDVAAHFDEGARDGTSLEGE
jgi:hypothetical protein